MFQYLGQCDALRRQPGGESAWQQMMQVKVAISQDEFENLCDFQPLLDPDETLDQWLADPDAEFYRSRWKNQDCVFVQTAGFEFIFAEKRTNPDKPTQWAYNEEDDFGEYHSRSRKTPCPECGTLAREAECFDVGGRWISCRSFLYGHLSFMPATY